MAHTTHECTCIHVYVPPVSVPDGSNTSPAKATERVNIFLLKVTYQNYTHNY